MPYFASVLARADDQWRGVEVDLDDCETITDVVDIALDVPGELRLVLVEQDDEYAAIVRLDGDDSEPRIFVSDGHAADNYPLAAMIAEELGAVGDDDGLLGDAPPGHESEPLGETGIVEDLGTPSSDLVRMCTHEGTLPIDVLSLVCEKAGCGPVFDDLRV